MSALVVAPIAAATATTEPPPSANLSDSPTLEELAAMVPATSFPGSGGTLYYVDMSLLWDQLDAGTDPGEREQRLGEFNRVENYAFLPRLFESRTHEFDEARAEVGFSAVEIERELAVSAFPESVTIDVTNVPVSDVEDALESDPMWSPDLTAVDTDVGSYYAWGEGTERFPDRYSPLHPIGVGGQVAVLGDSTATTIRTFEPAQIEASLATTAGSADSAATSVVLGPVLDVLDGADVLQLVATAQGPIIDFAFVITAESQAEAEELFELIVPLNPYLSLAIAQIATPEGRGTEILLVNVDEEDAAANAEIVTDLLATGVVPGTRQPLSEELPDAEVTVDGRVVRVLLTHQDAFRNATRMMEQRSLFPAG